MFFRRLCILIAYVTLFTRVVDRQYAVAVLCLLCAAAHLWLRPFKTNIDNLLEGVSLCMLTYAAMSKSAFSEREGKKKKGKTK